MPAALLAARPRAGAVTRPLLDAIERFDQGTLRPAGTPYFASRAVSWLMPDAHGFVFVGEPGGHTRVYSHGLQAGAFKLRRSKVREFIACARAWDMAFPAALLAAMGECAGRWYPSLEALLEDLRAGTGTAEPMPMPWHDFGLIFLMQLCRGSRSQFVLAAKAPGHSVTWRGVLLQPRQLERLRGVLPKAVCAALAPLCGQIFADAEALLQGACACPSEPTHQESWQAWAAALHGETQHLMGAARTGHRLDQDDERYLAARPSLRCRAYPEMRHEFVRDAWRQLFWGREYLRESVCGLMALTSEEAAAQRQRLAPAWTRYVPGSTPELMPAAWFAGYAQRLPHYEGMHNCNAAAAALLREGAYLQRMHALREGLPMLPTPTLRGPSWRNLGTSRLLPVWRPVREPELEALEAAAP